MMIGSNVASSFLLTWQIYISSWKQDWKQYERHVTEMSTRNFVQVPVAANLVWNVVGLCLLMTLAVHFAEFSAAFEQFAIVAMILPCLVGSIGFYAYLLGLQTLRNQLTFASFSKWIYNFASLQGMMLCSASQMLAVYMLGLHLEAYLPNSCRGTILFAKEDHELALKVAVFYFWALFAVLALTLPLWQKGYQLARHLVNQKSLQDPENAISKTRVFLELFYQTCQSNTYTYLGTPMCIIAQYRYGIQFHYIHLVLASIEVLLFNFVVKYKFCILHQLHHKIPALYNMTHIEHHICKTIHPTTPAAGLWEYWVGAETIFFAYHALLTIPYSTLQALYCGANLVVHTMWPHPSLIQWHTFHHTCQADIYSLNIPSDYDKKFSKIYQKHVARFTETSPFMRNEALSDAAAFVAMLVMGCIFHYGFGVGLGMLDWSTGLKNIESG